MTAYTGDSLKYFNLLKGAQIGKRALAAFKEEKRNSKRKVNMIASDFCFAHFDSIPYYIEGDTLFVFWRGLTRYEYIPWADTIKKKINLP